MYQSATMCRMPKGSLQNGAEENAKITFHCLAIYLPGSDRMPNYYNSIRAPVWYRERLAISLYNMKAFCLVGSSSTVPVSRAQHL